MPKRVMRLVFNYQLMFGTDKLMHFAGFAVFAAFFGLMIILVSEYQEVKQRISVVWITLVTIGIIEEYRQYWLPNRSTEFLDAIANIAGVTIGLALPLLFVFLVRHRRQFFSKALGLYTFVLIPLLIGLLYLNERPFFTYEERIQERIRSLAALVGW
ncbi:VanZ family protein [Mesobacillus boroniphilus]|nr:VanZ family protein [Mesobacillus boroniphilus]